MSTYELFMFTCKIVMLISEKNMLNIQFIDVGMQLTYVDMNFIKLKVKMNVFTCNLFMSQCNHIR